MAKLPKLCVYCGGSNSLTRDHIPPRSLFKKPRPATLITVSACKSCNQSFGPDDDYFWLTLSSRREATKNAEANEASLRAIKNLSRSEAIGFRSAFLASVQPVDMQTPEGLYVGTSLAYTVSFPRLNRVAARITKGLVCFERKCLLPSEYIATARAIEGFPSDPGSEFLQLLRFVKAVEGHRIGEVFAYRIRAIDGDPHASVVLFDVYETTTFLGLIIRSQDRHVWDEWI